ncbi:MAG: hypothetical protein AAGA36_14645 [Pseudomonadota bacterium]
MQMVPSKIVVATLLATTCWSCSGEDAATERDSDAEAAKVAVRDPGDDLIIVFADPMADPQKCAPQYTILTRKSDAFSRVNTDFNMDDYAMHGSGTGMRDLDEDGIVNITWDGDTFAIEGKPCSEVAFKMRPTRCENKNFETVDCPPVKVEGTEIFASFEQSKY